MVYNMVMQGCLSLAIRIGLHPPTMALGIIEGLRTPISFSHVVKMWFARFACRIRDAMSALSLVRLGAWHIPGVLTGSRRTLWGLMAPVFAIEVAVVWKMGDKESQGSTRLQTPRVIVSSSRCLVCDLDDALKVKYVH